MYMSFLAMFFALTDMDTRRMNEIDWAEHRIFSCAPVRMTCWLLLTVRVRVADRSSMTGWYQVVSGLGTSGTST